MVFFSPKDFFVCVWIIFKKLFIEFVMVLLLLHVLGFFGQEVLGIFVPRPGIELIPLHWKAKS